MDMVGPWSLRPQDQWRVEPLCEHVPCACGRTAYAYGLLKTSVPSDLNSWERRP